MQAPYIATSEDEYIAMTARLKPMDLSASKQEAEDKFCDGEACQISF